MYILISCQRMCTYGTYVLGPAVRLMLCGFCLRCWPGRLYGLAVLKHLFSSVLLLYHPSIILAL